MAKKKIDYRNGEECLHLTYQDMQDMTLEDAIYILSQPVERFHNAKSESNRVNLPRPQLIRAYELAIDCMNKIQENSETSKA